LERQSRGEIRLQTGSGRSKFEIYKGLDDGYPLEGLFEGFEILEGEQDSAT
jgi:hypothetical protein